MSPVFNGFGKKLAFFHGNVPLSSEVAVLSVPSQSIQPGFHSEGLSFILNCVMKKRKKDRFDVTKAVKANARERVGQPKPARVIDTEPKEGRKAKYKPLPNEQAEAEG
jgi:hypothetical protein